MPPQQDPAQQPQPQAEPAQAPAPNQPAAPPITPQVQPLQVAQPTPQPDPEASRYDFFLDPAVAPAKPKLLPIPNVSKNMSSFSKVILAAVISFVILGILAVLLSVSRSGGDDTASLNSVAFSQQEIIRVSELGQNELESQMLLNFVATATASVTSSQQALITYASTHGGGIDTKLLPTAKNATVDETLNAAKSAGSYDSTFRTTMQQLIQDYKIKTSRAAAAASTTSQRTLLEKQSNDTVLLEQMLTVE